MTQNALIAALEKAVAEAKVSSPKDDIGSEILSKYLARELNGLSKPSDPTQSLSPLEFWLRATVANPTLDQSEIARLRTFHELLAPAHSSEEVAGAIGFLLCCRSADRAQSLKADRYSSASNDTAREVEAALADASKFLTYPAVRNWIAAYYAIDGARIADPRAKATMIASGTTSYVIRFTGSADFVLKLVKPQFMASALIREQTSSYGDLLIAEADSNPLLPRVHATGSSYIVMEYIHGKSLTDLMDLGILDGMTIAERRELLYGIIGNLEALRSPHLDLSPGNIMVESLPVAADGSRRFKVRLIDFGYNYLLREGLSGVPVRSDIVRYSAPEMMAGSYQGSTKADLYSLGMLILDVMRTSPKTVDLSVQLDRCWQTQPQLAAIAEELIANEPDDRAPWSRGLDQANTYRALRRRLEQEEMISGLVGTRLKARDALGGKDGIFRELKRIVREIPTLRRLAKDDVTNADAIYLYWWSAAINTFLLASLAICGYELFFQTIDVISFKPAELSLHELAIRWNIVVAKFHALLSPESQAILAGQVIALTIILVVQKYYSGIFSPITTRSNHIAFARRAEVTMRSTPVVIGLLCVSTAVWFPGWWCVTSLIGPLVVALNNGVVLRFCQNVRQEASRRVIVGNLETTDIARFDETFQRWWSAMVYTGLLICAVGLLLRVGVIGDEAFLGFALAFLCYAALYQSASTDMSALVRGGIRRYAKVAERMQAAPAS
jgi:Protein kinase domain